MVSPCIVNLCPNIGVHRFPKNEERRTQWIQAIQYIKPGLKVRNNSLICSAHFRRSDFSVTTCFTKLDRAPKILLKTAIPSVFPWNQVSQIHPSSQDSLIFDPTNVHITYKRIPPITFVEEQPSLDTIKSEIIEDPLQGSNDETEGLLQSSEQGIKVKSESLKCSDRETEESQLDDPQHFSKGTDPINVATMAQQRQQQQIKMEPESSDEFEVNCRLCPKVFASVIALQNHARMFHVDAYLTGDPTVWTDESSIRKEPSPENPVTSKSIINSSQISTLVKNLSNENISYIIIKTEPSAPGEKKRKKLKKDREEKPKRVEIKKEPEAITGPFECLEPSTVSSDGSCHQMFFSCCEYSEHQLTEHARPRRQYHKCQMSRKIDDEPALYYVVQFLELPFEGIDDYIDYVCVPYGWLRARKAMTDKVAVAYPKDEDPFDTRERAERKERYNENWRTYMAAVKYKSNSYRDAEYWIASRNDYGPLIVEESKVTDTQPKLPVNKKLRSGYQNHLTKSNDNFRKPLPRMSINQPGQSKFKAEIGEKRLKLDESAQSSSSVVNDAKVEPKYPKRKHSAIIQDNQSIEFSQPEESSVADENTEPRSKTPRTERTEEALSSPTKDVQVSEVINIDDEDHSQRVKKPDHNIISQVNPSSNTSDVSTTAAKLEKKIDDHKLLNEVPSQKLSTSYEGLHSSKMSANLYRHMNEGRRLIPIHEPVERIIRPMKMDRNLAIAAQNPSNSIQTRNLSTSSVEPPVANQNQSQNDHGNSRNQTAPLRSIEIVSQEIHGQRINYETSNDLASVDPRNVLQSVNNAAASSQLLPSLSNKHPSYIRRSDGHQNLVANNQDKFHHDNRGFTKSNTYDHRPTSQTINMRIPSIRQNSIHLSNLTYQTPELAEQRQMQPNDLDSQQQPRPKIRIDISIKPKNRKQKPSLQGVTKKTLPSILTNLLNSLRKKLSTTNNNFSLNNPQLQARIRSTRDNNGVSTTSPQNIIASETSDRQNTDRPSRPIHQPSRIQNITAHENGYQNLSTQEQLLDQSTQTNSKTNRVQFMDDAVTSPVTGSHLNVIDNACQTDEGMVDETLSQYHAVSSDSDAVTDEDAISESEMSANEIPVEATNNIYGTAKDLGHGSADRPIAVPNSTSINQAHPKIILEQQMLDNFATLFTQMGSTLRYTTDMYNNLRSSKLDTAVTYKKLLGSVEEFNTASNTSPSINLRPKSPQFPKERHTKVTASASSSNQEQQSNNVANRTPKIKHKKLFRFILPPEYDSNDTKWTLKYPTYLAGLAEMMHGSGVYVSYGDLKYCEQVSKDCQSLARRLLPEIFNRNALSVCSTMSETAKACNNVGSNIRPELDDHACSVLLSFVIEHGLQRGWNTDLKPILDGFVAIMRKKTASLIRRIRDSRNSILGTLSNRCSSAFWVCERPLSQLHHDGSKGFVCENLHCGKSFDTEEELTKHRNDLHVPKKRFECTVCFKKFSAQGGVVQHMRMHTGDRPYHCTFCPKAFTQKSGLEQHLRTHTKVKPFRCVICSKTFVQTVHLKQHMRTHTNVAPFQCALCDKRFKQSSHLNYHLKNHLAHPPPDNMTDEQRERYREIVARGTRKSGDSGEGTEPERSSSMDRETVLAEQSIQEEGTYDVSETYAYVDSDSSAKVVCEVADYEVSSYMC